jgi:hypothetical protein
VDDAKIAALVNKLCAEFANELKDMRQDVDYLQDDVSDLADRVSYLEEQAKGPKVFGWLDYRIGFDGTGIDFQHEFDNMTAMVGIQGKITDAVSGRIALKVRDQADPTVAVDGYAAETVWLDEANISANSKFLLPATWTFGRQYQSYGMGLLVDNERKSQQGVRIQVPDIFGSNLDVDLFGGGIDGKFDGSPLYNYPIIGGKTDSYLSGRVAYTRPTWSLGGNYLSHGAGDERGWSADLAAQIWGRDIRAEYASEDRDVNGVKQNDNKAWMASADLWRGNNWRLTGFYSEAQENYTMVYSALNPYYENLQGTSAFAVPWEKWLRNPLILSSVQTIGGHLDFHLASMPFTAAYFNLKGKDGFVPNYDTLWAIGTSKQLADGVTANVTYGQENANSDHPLLRDQKLLQAGVAVGF